MRTNGRTKAIRQIVRTACVAIFSALLSGSATADQIDLLVTNLPPGWGDGATPIINQPETTSLDQLLPRAFHCWRLEDSVGTYKVIMSRQVSIPRAHIPRAYKDSYLAALVQTSQREWVVLFRYDPFVNGWWSRFFPFPPDLSPIVGGDPIMNWFDFPARRDPQTHLALVEVLSITDEHHTYTEAQNSKVSDDNGKTWYNLLNVWSGTANLRMIESPGVEMPTNFAVTFVRQHYVHSRSEPWTQDWVVKPRTTLLGFFVQKDGKWLLQSGFLDPVDYLLLPGYGNRLQSLFRTPLADETTLAERKRKYDEARLRAIHQAETNNPDTK